MGNRIVQINGHYLNVFHEGRGLPIVLLHGWGASWRHWETLIPKLTAAGYTVYAPDLYGHGESDHPASAADYPIAAYYNSICRWMNTEGLERPFLIGHSMGAYLSLKYALDHPQNVPGLTLINPLIASEQIVVSPLFSHPKLAVLGELLLKLTPEWLIKTSLDLNRQDLDGLPDSFQHQTALDYKRASPHIARTLTTIKDLRPHLTGVQTPILFTWGDKDITLKPDMFPPILNALPNATGICFEGCYHAPHLSQSERFVELLLPFINKTLLGSENI